MKRKPIKTEDISGQIGQLYKDETVKYPMYSFDRPAFRVWQGVYDGLLELGKTKKQALDILQSKYMRWALDGEFSDILQQAGKDYALKHGKDWKL